ncbi:hypothetical protein ASPBRDRAFT_26158 [Aspergillus brasiliensis CBS 101740]|uniref:Uncharacterized protein n=1 Tax=Aspergillus brasiliensis (strain CBS 101740 / IMI 381727 / IBT 21946) TaxID=767769 RepID=A0A1L9UVH1_ASPBC|nr:hypothetical protein ASPBRDRAFT_26158 [Aspergillus brasiliensis CBS 101740]
MSSEDTRQTLIARINRTTFERVTRAAMAYYLCADLHSALAVNRDCTYQLQHCSAQAPRKAFEPDCEHCSNDVRADTNDDCLHPDGVGVPTMTLNYYRPWRLRPLSNYNDPLPPSHRIIVHFCRECDVPCAGGPRHPPPPPAKTRAALRREALKTKKKKKAQKKKLVEGRATAKELLEEAERLEKAAAAKEEEARRKRTQKSIPDSRSESYDLTAPFWKPGTSVGFVVRVGMMPKAVGFTTALELWVPDGLVLALKYSKDSTIRLTTIINCSEKSGTAAV